MGDNVSALPASMQARRAALEAGAEVHVPAAPAPAAPAPASSTSAPTELHLPAPSSTVTDAKVTISREEFNDLQAAAGKARAAEGRAETLAMDVEALTRRLTELEDGPKGSTKPAATPVAATWEPTPVEYTDKDTEDYGDSKPFVMKVIQEALNRELPKLIARLEAVEEQVGGVRTLAEGASKAASNVRAKSYTDKVRERVENFDECTNHKNWRDFTESTDPDTGDTWGELIQRNFNKENIPGMVRVFKTFKEKYGVGEAPKPTGYEGVLPGNSGTGEEPPQGPKMLPFSDRKKAHKQYINQEISFQEYERIKNEYDAADREGRVDYNK